MNHQQDRLPYGLNCMPALLAINGPIFQKQQIGIVKHAGFRSA